MVKFETQNWLSLSRRKNLLEWFLFSRRGFEKKFCPFLKFEIFLISSITGLNKFLEDKWGLKKGGNYKRKMHVALENENALLSNVWRLLSNAQWLLGYLWRLLSNDQWLLGIFRRLLKPYNAMLKIINQKNFYGRVDTNIFRV